jgi:hypothetical protein
VGPTLDSMLQVSESFAPGAKGTKHKTGHLNCIEKAR